jgi:DNA (cytosine-5)-methyltransferase 1
MSYQKTTGPLMANSHPGSYCGQDAYSDMLITEPQRERESMGDDHREELCADHGEVTGDQGERLEGSEHSVYAARRLTPTECARLQGFPPDWAADIPHTDSQEYKMWGNGIALPCLLPMMKAMADELDFSKHMNPPEENNEA